jgi:hypothetical protein
MLKITITAKQFTPKEILLISLIKKSINPIVDITRTDDENYLIAVIDNPNNIVIYELADNSDFHNYSVFNFDLAKFINSFSISIPNGVYFALNGIVIQPECINYTFYDYIFSFNQDNDIQGAITAMTNFINHLK